MNQEAIKQRLLQRSQRHLDPHKVTRKSVTHSQIQELDDIHCALDEAVLDAYGWPHYLTDEQILERLLALNLKRASFQGKVYCSFKLKFRPNLSVALFKLWE